MKNDIFGTDESVAFKTATNSKKIYVVAQLFPRNAFFAIPNFFSNIFRRRNVIF